MYNSRKTTVACLERDTHESAFRIFSTCTSSTMATGNYVERISEVARWSEAAGCTGILVYTDNSLVDPWLVSQIIIQSTRALCPLVAVQPVYMHPYSVAKMIASLASLHSRKVYLNMVAGGFRNDLIALGDETPHDRRYQRLIEYTQIVRQLLESRAAVTYEGEFYRVKALTMTPAVVPDLLPGILVSGSSDAGMAAASAMGAIAIRYPEPPDSDATGLPAGSGPCGVRLGIVTRERETDAWNVALTRFPDDRRGQLTRQLATKISDSNWHQRLTGIQNEYAETRQTYWLHPFENYQTNCPYLVGSYENVASELARYLKLGYGTFILDIPAAEEEFEHIRTVFADAAKGAGL